MKEKVVIQEIADETYEVYTPEHPTNSIYLSKRQLLELMQKISKMCLDYKK